MDTEQPLHTGPLLGFRAKAKELHPDAYVSPRMGQWKATVLPGKCSMGRMQV